MGSRRNLADINSIIIHCSDTPDGRNVSAKEIDQWHKARGFKRDISIAPNYSPSYLNTGYHFVIELNGALQPGRPLIETGSHAQRHNLSTIGICLVGRGKYTSAQWHALYGLILNLKAQCKNIESIVGHCSVDANKECPCFDVADWLERSYTPRPENVLELNHD